MSEDPIWHGEERRLDNRKLIEEVAEAAAETAVKKAASEFYASVGRGVVSKVLTAIGLFAVGWMASKGISVK